MLGIGAGSLLLPQSSALGMPLLHGPDGAINLLNNIQVGNEYVVDNHSGNSFLFTTRHNHCNANHVVIALSVNISALMCQIHLLNITFSKT